MKASIIFNTINRSDITPTVMGHNFKNMGVPRSEVQVIVNDNGSTEQGIKDWIKKEADLPVFQKENIGNAQGLNFMMRLAKGEFIALLGNDILMPGGWLKAAMEAINDIPKSGLVGFNWQPVEYPVYDINSHRVSVATLNPNFLQKIFGSWVFKRSVWEKVGYFDEFSRYSLWDSCFNFRCLYAGFVNYYLHGYNSKHQGTGKHDTGEYRKMKNDEMKKAVPLYEERCRNLSESRYYVDENQKLIEK